MMIENFADRYLRRYPMAATASYFAAVAASLFVTWTATADIYQRHAALTATADLVAQLEARQQHAALDAERAPVPGPAGSPLLEGPTVTVAGAGLLQRMAAAVIRSGGNVLSSQIDLQGTLSKDGYVSVIVNCELDQPGLQKLLYDLESGMPFLFVDQLAVQTLAGASAETALRLRVLLPLSGLWQGQK